MTGLEKRPTLLSAGRLLDAPKTPKAPPVLPPSGQPDDCAYALCDTGRVRNSN